MPAARCCSGVRATSAASLATDPPIQYGMPQAEYDVARPRSNITTSRSGCRFLACEAALPPAASPPITTRRLLMPADARTSARPGIRLRAPRRSGPDELDELVARSARGCTAPPAGLVDRPGQRLDRVQARRAARASRGSRPSQAPIRGSIRGRGHDQVRREPPGRRRRPRPPSGGPGRCPCARGRAPTGACSRRTRRRTARRPVTGRCLSSSSGQQLPDLHERRRQPAAEGRRRGGDRVADADEAGQRTGAVGPPCPR